MFKSEHLQEKWQPVLDHPDLAEVKDPYRRAVTSIILENQEGALKEQKQFLSEDAPTNSTGAGVQNWDPILISLVRRAMPNLIAYDVCGVQPMTGPTGLIFAMRSKYEKQAGSVSNEALFDEADTGFSGNAAGKDTGHNGSDPLNPNAETPGHEDEYKTGGAMTTAEGEALGDADDNHFPEMAFTIEKSMVQARTRALKAEYTMELAQDLKAIHGLEAESELANILSSEILTEINREVIRTIYTVARKGAMTNTTTPGTFDLDTDSNGRWSVEKFKGLHFQMERDANAIAQLTRRGRGNVLICSSDVASALQAAGVLDYTPALNNNLAIDDAGNTFAGVLNGKYKVYIDPFSANQSLNQYYCMGYRGPNAYDAGIFYCPYIPLQMVRAVGEQTFQPKIGFKTRYGMAQNPFANDPLTEDVSGLTYAADGQIASPRGENRYYRKVRVTNLM